MRINLDELGVVQVVQPRPTLIGSWINEVAYGPSTATNEFTAFTQLGFPVTSPRSSFTRISWSAADRTMTTSYLSKKWLGVSGTSGVTNSLSPALCVDVAVGTALTGVAPARLAELSGSGRVTNGTVTVTGRLRPAIRSAAWAC